MCKINFADWLCGRILKTGEKKYRESLKLVQEFMKSETAIDWQYYFSLLQPEVMKEYESILQSMRIIQKEYSEQNRP